MRTGFDFNSKVNFNYYYWNGIDGEESFFYVLIDHSFKFWEKMWILDYKKQVNVERGPEKTEAQTTYDCLHCELF